MDKITAYAEIIKVDDQPDGTVIVHGRATSPDLDSDRQICDPDWLKQAMPEWFTWGNVREQHSAIAAGVGKTLTQNGPGWDLTSHVVDTNSARKVKAGVLKGYSIGIANPRVIADAQAPGGRIVGGQIVEVSLVDRPANPTCTLALAKALKPGPGITKAGTIDTERRLVKVEELYEQADRAGEPLQLCKALGFDLIAVQKGNSAQDIADAQQAIALIAGLIQSEAACLADGMASEACDIDLLLGAAKALQYFINRENEEAAMAHVELSDTPDATKAAAPGPATEQPPPVQGDLAKAKKPVPPVDSDEDDEAEGDEAAEKAVTPETPDLTQLVKAAVAEAIAPLQERLAKAEAAPQAGGPVLTRTQQDSNKAAVREGLLTKAADYEATAAALTGDPSTQRAYRAEAKKLRDQAALAS